MFKPFGKQKLGKLSTEKGEQEGERGKEANACGVNWQGQKPVASFWVLLEKEKRTKDTILYGRKF